MLTMCLWYLIDPNTVHMLTLHMLNYRAYGTLIDPNTVHMLTYTCTAPPD